MIADESLPEHSLERFVHSLGRLPSAVFAHMVTQTTTHPLRNMEGPLRSAGFANLESIRVWSGFVVIYAIKGDLG